MARMNMRETLFQLIVPLLCHIHDHIKAQATTRVRSPRPIVDLMFTGQ